MCNIPSRIKDYLNFKCISNAAFEKSLGMSNGSFGKQLRTNGAIGSDKLENILMAYPDISPEWLLTGKGEMLKTNCTSRQNFVDQPPVVISKNAEISADMQVSDRRNYPTRPRIPIDAAAGSLSIALTSVSQGECEQLPVIPTFPQYDFTIAARGESMQPVIESGDELACRFIHESAFIQWGRIHVLDTAQGIVVKRIFESNGHIICRSDNKNYPDFPVTKEEIYHMALVVGLIRQF